MTFSRDPSDCSPGGPPSSTQPAGQGSRSRVGRQPRGRAAVQIRPRHGDNSLLNPPSRWGKDRLSRETPPHRRPAAPTGRERPRGQPRPPDAGEPPDLASPCLGTRWWAAQRTGRAPRAVAGEKQVRGATLASADSGRAQLLRTPNPLPVFVARDAPQ